MKKKIPVGATIAHAYRFVFGNALTVLKAIWLPLLAQLAVSFLLIKRMALFFAATLTRDPSAASLFGPLLLLVPLLFIFFCAQFAAATETAAGNPPQSWIAFHFGKTMWRLTGGFLLALLAITVIGGLTLLVSTLGMVVFNFSVKIAPGNMLVAGLVALAVIIPSCVVVFTAIRFLFLLAPVNVLEQRQGVRRAWALSAGNFWRAFLITLAIVLPVAIINYVYGIVMAGPLHIPPGTPTTGKDAVAAIRAALAAQRITQLNAMADQWYLTLPLNGLMMWFQLGAGCAAQVFVWRKLTEDEGLAPIAGD